MSGCLKNLHSKALRKGDPEPAPLAPGHARMYNMRFCPWTQRVIIYMAKKNIPCEIVNIHLQDKPEWYFKKNPEGKVPTFEYNGKEVLESGLIPEFLDDSFPGPRILPSDPFEKYQQKLLTDQLAGLAPAFYGLVAASRDPSLKEEKFANVSKALEKAESLLTNNFYGGASVGYADYLVFPMIERIWLATSLAISPLTMEGFPGTSYPKLAAWFKTMQKLPEVETSTHSLENSIKFIKSYMSGAPDYDIGI